MRKSLQIDRTLAETFGLDINFRRQYICILYDDKARPAYFMSIQHNDKIEATDYAKGLRVYMSSLILHSPLTHSKLKWWKLCRRKLPTRKNIWMSTGFRSSNIIYNDIIWIMINNNSTRGLIMIGQNMDTPRCLMGRPKNETQFMGTCVSRPWTGELFFFYTNLGRNT